MKTLMTFGLALALGLSLGCGREDAQDMAKQAEEAAAAATEQAEQAAADAAAKAEEAAQAATEAADAMAQEAQDAVAGAGAAVAEDVVAACRAAAEASDWAAALEVCTKAHEMLPDDMQIEHALQQAQAAAEG